MLYDGPTLCKCSTMLDQRRRPWVNVVEMLSTCFMFAGKTSKSSLEPGLIKKIVQIVMVL